MIATRTRVKAAALLGGAAVITATVTGVATAGPGSPPDDGRATTVICTAPGGGDVPGLPPLSTEPGTHFEHVVPGRQTRELRIERAVPGTPGPPIDGPVECRQIEPGDEFVPAPGGFGDVVPRSGSADSAPARPF